MEFLKSIWEKAVAFASEGYNLYYIIGAVVLLVVLIVVISVCASKKKKKKRLEEVAETPVTKNANESENLFVKEEENIAASTAPYTEIEPEAHTVPVYIQPKTSQEKTQEVKKEEVEKKEVKETAPAIPLSSIEEPKLTKVISLVPVPEKKKPEKPVEVAEVKKAEPTPSEEELRALREEILQYTLKRPGVVQIYKDAGNKFRFRFKAVNTETVAHSQGYTAKNSCKNGINSVKNAVDIALIVDLTKKENVEYVPQIGSPVFEIYKDNESKYRFRLRAANTSTILASQGYTSKASCINGIKSVRHIALNHTLVDDTKASAQKE